MQKRYPFKFLDAYNRQDTDIFFGRDEEIEALYQMTFQSDILLVYGASGTGKTSLIQCGLASRFQAHDWLALHIRRGSDLNVSLQQKLDEVTAGVVTGPSGHDLSWLDEYEEESTKGSAVTRQLQEIYRQFFRPVYLIFDQFEELYILGSKTEQEQFIRSVQEIQSVDHPVKMFFVIREEYLGHLFEFERAVPQLLRKKLRVEPMNLDKVGQVVYGATTLRNTNVRLQEGEEELIVEGIFQKIRGDEQTLAIQLPYLQVFLDKLYVHITGDESRQEAALFTAKALSEIGNIGDVLRDFLEEQAVRIQKQLSQQYPKLPADTVWQILSPLATLEGTKEPMPEEDLLQRLAHLPAPAVQDGLRDLDQSRILRFDEDTARYEVAHDSLAARIAEHRSDDEIALMEIRRLITSQLALKADARALFTEKQLSLIEPYLDRLALEPDALEQIRKSRAEIRAKSRRVRRRNILIGGVLALAAIVSIFFAIDSRNSARKAKDSELKAMEVAKIAEENEKKANIREQEAEKAKRESQHSLELARAAELETKQALSLSDRLRNRAEVALNETRIAKDRANQNAEKAEAEKKKAIEERNRADRLMGQVVNLVLINNGFEMEEQPYLDLYFDNDQPGSRSRSVVSPVTYLESLEAYRERFDEYIVKAVAGKSEEEAFLIKSRMVDMKENELNGSIANLKNIIQTALEFLKLEIPITMEVSACISPLAIGRYNELLAMRRIDSIRKELQHSGLSKDQWGDLFKFHAVVNECGFKLDPSQREDLMSMYSLHSVMLRRVKITLQPGK